MTRRTGRSAWGWGGLVGAILLAGCSHIGRDTRCEGDCPPGGGCHPAKVCTDPTLMALGHDLDHLERHIDWYGSVVARGPDVWGQARLTQHREEFEKEMFKDFDEFGPNLQGSLARSDQAFFAHATALSLAAQPKPPAIGRVTTYKQAAPLVPASQDVVVLSEKTVTGGKDEAATTQKNQSQTTNKFAPAAEVPGPEVIKAATNPDLTKELTDIKESIKRSELKLDRIGFDKKLKDGGVGLEPTLVLAQKKRYLDYLNQIRRDNEGDDTADSPGYSLNLVRIPVSLLPGKRTDTGHGAEITMTLTPVLGDDLLPMTFRNLVANDLRHQLGLPLAQFLNDDKEAEEFLNAESRQVLMGLPWFNRLVAASTKDTTNTPKPGESKNHYLVGAVTNLRKEAENNPGLLERVKAVVQLLENPARDELVSLINTGVENKSGGANNTGGNEFRTLTLNSKGNPLSNTSGGKQIAKFGLKVNVPALAHSPGLINKTGFPTSQLFEVYGLSNCFQIAYAAHAAFHESIARQKYAHLPDIQGFLQQETIAAYRFLAEPATAHLWAKFCTPEVTSAVRLRQADKLEDLREQFRYDMQTLTAGAGGRVAHPHLQPGEYSTTAALAWCILVDSALLTDKLIRDMGEVSSAKRQPLPSCGMWLDYYHPHPSPEARQAFAAYVALRWPVRVFALDPDTQDQNIADALSTRRETQLALSIAFTNGFINANTLTRYARRLEAEYETIALNRTQVGFGHGENTFGWRFYPRFQTPDTESNLTVFFRDQLIGGPNRNALLRDRRLEPGPRECVALVMMPSFVPYVTMDTVGNWFGLANPKHKVLDHTQALKMSRTVQTLKTCGPGVKDAACYRDGEFERMLRRVEQLEARLPSQTARFPVPVMNTLGGFEMFSNGTTDLAPELYGWYGAPGVSKSTTTTLFLVGDHFSPLHNKVIVGNKPAGNPKLLSRQVMQVEVATDAVPLEGTHVTAHLATPYGVTRELRIPIVDAVAAPPPATKEGFSLKTDVVTLPYCATVVPNTDGRFNITVQDPAPRTKAEIKWDDALGVAPAAIKVRFEFEYNKKSYAFELPNVPEKNGVYALDAASLKAVAKAVLDTLKAYAPYSEATNPFAGELRATVVVTPLDGTRAVRETTLTAPLRFTFQGSFCEQVAPQPLPTPRPAPPESKKDTPRPPAPQSAPPGGQVPIPLP